MSGEAPRIERRRVHYVPGFDPRGAAYYHRLMKDEAARPQPSGDSLSTTRRKRIAGDIHGWTVTAARPGHTVETAHEFMSWDDVVRSHWPRGPMALWRAFWLAYVGIVRDVQVPRAHALHTTIAWTGMLPGIYLGLTLLLGIILGLGAWALIGGTAGILAGLGTGAALVAGTWSYAQWKGLFWLMRILTFVMRLSRGPVPALDARCRSWVEHIIERQRQDPVDEVILVGHSIGTLVMVPVVDALLQDPRWQALQAGRRTCMLTLGQCFPFLALPARSDGFRGALARLCDDPRLAWLDVTALIDPLCFYRAHPLAGTGLERGRTARPVHLAARFFQMYAPARWSQIRKDKLRTHFLYLMTPDKPGNFNLYELLYGSQPFEQALGAAGGDKAVTQPRSTAAAPARAGARP